MVSSAPVVVRMLKGENADQIEDVPEQTKDLKTQDELLAALQRPKSARHGQYATHVLETLKRVEDGTIVVGAGQTVADLIKENHFNKWADCSKEALEHRANLVESFKSESSELEGIVVYLEKNVFNSAVTCGANRDDIGKQINSEKWLERLNELCEVVAIKRWDAKVGAVMDFILDRPHQKRPRRGKAVRKPAPVEEPEEEEESVAEVEQVDPETETETESQVTPAHETEEQVNEQENVSPNTESEQTPAEKEEVQFA